MQSEMNDGLTLKDLEIQKLGLIDRIKRLEKNVGALFSVSRSKKGTNP